MGYSKEKITMEEAKARVSQYPYALVNLMSKVYLGIPSGISITWEELLEARFFSEKEELHICKCEKEWGAVVVSDQGNSEDTITKSYKIAQKYKDIGKELIVKEYLAADEDGQMYVELTRLCGIKGGE